MIISDKVALIAIIIIGFVMLAFLIWYTRPAKIVPTIDERIQQAEQKLMGQKKEVSYNDYLEQMEAELHHQNRRNTGKYKRK